MAKHKRVSKDLTDDWIKQVVTGQRHKLAHMADGGGVTADEPTPIGFAKYLMRGAQMLPHQEPVMPEIRQRMFTAPGAATAPAEPVQEAPAAAEPLAAPVATAPAPAITQYATGNLNKTAEALRAAGAFANGGCVKKLVAGGEVDGPGTETSDSIPAMLSDGEYVLPADTVDAVGKAALDKLKAATHTPTNKPSMKGMVMARAEGGGVDAPKFTDAQWAIARHFYPNTTDPAQAIENARSEDPAALQRVAGEVGMPGAPKTPLQQSSALRFFDPTRVMSSAAPAQPASPTATATTAVDTAPLAPTPPAAEAPVAAAKPVTAPNFMPTMSGPNTAQDMVSAGRSLMNTQGIGGFVQAKGLNRMAQTINQTNEPLIQGQFGLQREAMTVNERLEQAKLAEHQRQQNVETWTPDKNMMGELVGYGRTKGGSPEYVTKESLMAKPTLAQFLAKARPVNPKATDEQLTAHYNATYAPQ